MGSTLMAVDAKFKQDILAGRISPLDALRTFEAENGSRHYVRKPVETRIAQYIKSKQDRQAIWDQPLSFITPRFLPNFHLAQGLVLVGAQSGNSKSTTAANLISGFLAESTKDVIVISNEENIDSIYNRVACVKLQKSFTDYFLGRSPYAERQQIDALSQDMTARIEVVEDERWDMSMLEDVQAVLEHSAAPGSNIGLIVIDYLQTITQSRNDPDMDTFKVLKRFGLFLKDFGRKVGVPVVVFAQLKPEKECPDFQSRIQNDRTIYNHAFTAIEIRPDFKQMITTFKIHKDRFCGCQGKEVIMNYSGGRYEFGDDKGL